MGEAAFVMEVIIVEMPFISPRRSAPTAVLIARAVPTKNLSEEDRKQGQRGAAGIRGKGWGCGMRGTKVMRMGDGMHNCLALRLEGVHSGFAVLCCPARRDVDRQPGANDDLRNYARRVIMVVTVVFSH